MVVKSLDIFHLMLQVLFVHVDVQHHLYHLYKENSLIDKMIVSRRQVLITMLIVPVTGIEVRRQALMHVEHSNFQILINNFSKQLESNQIKIVNDNHNRKYLLLKDLLKVNILEQCIIDRDLTVH